MTLEEYIRASRELRHTKHPAEDEPAVFATIESRRQLIETARAKTRKARREAQKQTDALRATGKRGLSRSEDSTRSEELDRALGKVEPYHVEVWYGRRS